MSEIVIPHGDSSQVVSMAVSVKIPLSSSFLFEMSRINKHISSRSPQNIVLGNEKMVFPASQAKYRYPLTCHFTVHIFPQSKEKTEANGQLNDYFSISGALAFN